MAIDEWRFSIRVCTYWFAAFAFFINAGFIYISMLLNAIGRVAPPCEVWCLPSGHLLFSYFCVFHKCGFYRHVHAREHHRLGLLLTDMISEISDVSPSHLFFCYFCVFHKCGFYRHVHASECRRSGCPPVMISDVSDRWIFCASQGRTGQGRVR